MATREVFLALFGSASDAIEFENQALSVGDEFLPPAARRVRDGLDEDPGSDYWTWLCAQAEVAS